MWLDFPVTQVETPNEGALAAGLAHLAPCLVMCERTGLGSDQFLLKALADQSFRAFRKREFIC